ncbi:phage antirepressor N-terminal domain-containing protein [Tundrisphaera sp. TA3]|uniref:phage antirepressor N-terminal domain-containing protein n=1 Tax=Tundrisphaera sp. TA3 TaxID=3435775 RepID=UPI003EB9FE12
MRSAEKPFDSESAIGTIQCLSGSPGKDDKWVVLRSACDNMGVDLDTEIARLKRCSDVWSTIIDALILGPDGKATEVPIIDMRTFKMWLATIDVDQIKVPQHRAKIRTFQRQAKLVIQRELGPAPDEETGRMRWGY